MSRQHYSWDRSEWLQDGVELEVAGRQVVVAATKKKFELRLADAVPISPDNLTTASSTASSSMMQRWPSCCSIPPTDRIR